MSMKLLGETFDIHGGGLDLCFPHHEDEIAQSESYTGKPFAKYWMHNGLMQYSDQTSKIGARSGDFTSQERDKMSKSKGNTVTVTELLANHDPETIRYFLLATHYRSPIDFSDERIAEVGKGMARLNGFRARYERITGESFDLLSMPKTRAEPTFRVEGSTFLEQVIQLRTRFLDYMDDDFNTGGAIGVLAELLPLLNRFASEGSLEDGARSSADDRQRFRHAAGVLRELTALLGILLQPASAPADDGLVAPLVDLLLEVRQECRKSKNFGLSDLVRDRLKELGIVVKDRPDGSDWERGAKP